MSGRTAGARKVRAVITDCCVAPSHWSARRPDAVFIHDGRWAYCPSGRDAPGEHDWLRTGGVAMAVLERVTGAAMAAGGYRRAVSASVFGVASSGQTTTSSMTVPKASTRRT